MAERDADPSGNTAQFRAFAQRAEQEEPAWSMRAPRRRVAMLAGAVLAVVVVLVVIGLVVAR